MSKQNSLFLRNSCHFENTEVPERDTSNSLGLPSVARTAGGRKTFRPWGEGALQKGTSAPGRRAEAMFIPRGAKCPAQRTTSPFCLFFGIWRVPSTSSRSNHHLRLGSGLP